MVKKPKKTVEFQVTELFPGDISHMKPFVNYVDSRNNSHMFYFGENWVKVYRRLRNQYSYVSDLRSRPGDFRISFSANQKGSFVVKLIDRKYNKRFTLKGSTYEGVGASEPHFLRGASKLETDQWMKACGHIWREMYRGTDLYQDILFGKKK